MEGEKDRGQAELLARRLVITKARGYGFDPSGDVAQSVRATAS